MKDKTTHFSFKPGLVTGLIIAVAVLAGCASSTPAPIRDGRAPPPAEPSVTAPQADQTHVVRPGDTLMGIGRLYGQDVNDLIVWNNLMDPNQLRVGQAIYVSRPGAAGPEAVAIAQPIQIRPVMPGNGDVGIAPVKHEPRGGRQPYSDQAWAAIRPAAVPPPVTVEAPPPAPHDSAWLWPAAGPVIKGFDEVTNDGETPNKGVDIGGNPGDPVLASASGRVVYAGSGLRGFGKLVIIKHDDDYLSAYAHNQALLVKEGDEVNRGQRIAELGSTDADRPKLHFEIRRQGRPVDPTQYLPAR